MVKIELEIEEPDIKKLKLLAKLKQTQVASLIIQEIKQSLVYYEEQLEINHFSLDGLI
ncbi:MAG: hypothetical protein GF311_26665 [Candidatus Lokiarchaeota archaeon]|nr:hypothetical protein [Candidatus Lokiarchaeota archaeon]